ncbi:MAG: hypothetical protein V4620_01840 [Bacteroidota bacterium]
MTTPLKHILSILLAVFLASSFTPTDTTDNDLKLRGKPISFYLAHPQISQVCKDIYTEKREPSPDKDILALMDSMFTLNDETKAFYFLTVTQTMHKADGAYAEVLGVMAKSFVETRTREFLNYTMNEPLITEKYYNKWVKTVVGEIKICAEGHEKEEAGLIKNKMLKSCTECTEQQKDKLNDFAARVAKKCR